jgi:hypothetical protein
MNFSYLKSISLALVLITVSACKIKPPETREDYLKYRNIMLGGDEKAFLFTKKMLEDGTNPKIHFEQKFKSSPISAFAHYPWGYDPSTLKTSRDFNEWDRKVIKLLLDAGADINFVGEFMPTFNPFMAAIHANSVDLARFLLQHGADPHQIIYPRNEEPINAIVHMARGCADKTIPLLEELGFSFELNDWFTCDAMLAAQHHINSLKCKKNILNHFGTNDTLRCPMNPPIR